MALGIMRSRGVAWQRREGSATLLAPGGGLCLVCGVLAVWVCFFLNFTRSSNVLQMVKKPLLLLPARVL